MRRLLWAPLLAVLVGAAGAVPASAQEAPASYLVELAPGVDPEEFHQELASSAHPRPLTDSLPGLVASLRPGEARRLARHPDVQRVELDREVHVAAETPWGVDRIDQRTLPLDGLASRPAGGDGVRVYVVDTGVRADHVALTGRVQPGVQILDGVQSPDGGADCNGHGTHVAGILGGADVGVAPEVDVVPVRVMDCAGSGNQSDVIAGLDWVLQTHPRGTPGVVNISLAGPPSEILDSAIRAVHDAGLAVVVAAGNDSADACATSPAREPSAVTVGATDAADARASFSNYGSCLDLFAPGVRILSASRESPAAWAESSGTSMAAPHVTGILAQYLEVDPALRPADAAARLVGTATTGVVRGAGTGSPVLLAWKGPAAAPVEDAGGTPPPSEPDPDAAPVPEVQPAPEPEPVPEPEPEPVLPVFTDVPTDAYYAGAVDWAVLHDVTSGTTATRFSPKKTVTRGEAVTFLWRSQGRPAPTGTSGFTDVPQGAYYADAVSWAVERGITSGVKPGRFAPGDPVTRDQAVTLLWRLVGEPAAAPERFDDVAAGSYAAPAIGWAEEAGVTQGTSPTTFSPATPVNRADMVVLLHRLLES
ncbi:S8 family serine peptidase [Kineosporiaceae bacterium SCSIO 59966]|nr:S8 family serine peptidase [Kineosporiaceae bacterium SCSIO 59966]